MRKGTHERGLKQSIDWHLIGVYLVLVLIGWINIYASIHSSGPSSIFDWSVRSGKQFIWILTSFGLGALVLFVIPPQTWESGSLLFYLGVAFLLVLVIFVSKDVKGSHSWFELGPVKFQPAEISKISTSLLLASLMSRQGFRLSRVRDFWYAALVVGVPMLIILAESETGSALVYVGFLFVLYREGMSGWVLAAIGLVILLFILTLTASPYASILVLLGIVSLVNAFRFRDGLRWWLMVCLPLLLVFAFLPSVIAQKIRPIYLLLVLCAGLIPWAVVYGYQKRNQFLVLSAGVLVAGVMLVYSTDFIFNNVLQDHQRKRIEVLLGMKDDPAGVGYNVNQSLIAIGSGGLVGKGYLNGTQTTYGFVPEQSTDFIFCTVGEEWGFFGSALVVLLYVFLIYRIIRDAEQCREHFTRIYGYCVASCIFMHLFINIGMTIGLMPVIGIPLPLLSYGGSSLWAFTLLIFIFIALYRQEKKYF